MQRVFGCVGLGVPDPTPSDNAKKRVSVRDVGDPPPDAPFDLSLDVVDPWITDESTARLEATIENAGDRTDDFPPAFYKGSSEAHGAKGILLYSTDAPDCPPEDYVPPCSSGEDPSAIWRRADRDADYVSFTLEGKLQTALEPGESRTDTILVVDDPTGDGCVPEGSYQFSQTHAIAPPPGGEGGYTREELRSLDEVYLWEWTVVVEDVVEGT